MLVKLIFMRPQIWTTMYKKHKRIFPVSGNFNFQEFSIDDATFLTKAINHAITEIFPRTIKKV